MWIKEDVSSTKAASVSTVNTKKRVCGTGNVLWYVWIDIILHCKLIGSHIDCNRPVMARQVKEQGKSPHHT